MTRRFGTSSENEICSVCYCRDCVCDRELRFKEFAARVILQARSDAIWYTEDEYGTPIETVWPLENYL